MNITVSNYINNARELYYSNGNGSLFTYRPTRNLLVLWVFIFLAALSFWLRATNSNDFVTIAVMGLVILIFYSIFTITHCIKYFKWKKSVEEFVNGFRKFNICEINLTDNSFEMRAGDEAIIERWIDLKEFKIHGDHISFLNGSGAAYVIPSKSLTNEDFQLLSNFLRDKVR